MSKLSERVEERKAEAQALADKFNTVKAEIEKLQQEVKQDTTIKIEFSNDISDPLTVIDHHDGLDKIAK